LKNIFDESGLLWPGKEASRSHSISLPEGRLIKTPQFDLQGDGNNAIIEGDNLTAMKLIENALSGSVKFIYIDPPYNTGNRFTYHDKFRHSTGNEFERTVADWLSFMFPRLIVARDLMTVDGVFCASIDDSSAHYLRALLDEVFGIDNFVSQIVVESNKAGQGFRPIAKTHEYVLTYCKNFEVLKLNPEARIEELPHTDGKGSFRFDPLRNSNPRITAQNRPNLHFPIYVDPSALDRFGIAQIALQRDSRHTVEVIPVNTKGILGAWRWSRPKVQCAIDEFPISDRDVGARQKSDGDWNVFLKCRNTTSKAKSIWTGPEFTNDRGTQDLKRLGMSQVFDHPKPVELIRRLIALTTGPDETVLDFFAGSGTTGEAVLKQNHIDGGRRRFVLIQAAEPVQSGPYSTIADITRERVKRAHEAYKRTDGFAVWRVE
jgi:adenine-specific DNA-methyltransferase